MKKIVLIIVAFIFVLTGCASMEVDKGTAPIQTEASTLIDNSNVLTTEPAKDISANEPISQAEAESIALAECKVNYDYIETVFDENKNAWEIGFWENETVIAAQTAVIDMTGNILDMWYAE